MVPFVLWRESPSSLWLSKVPLNPRDTLEKISSLFSIFPKCL
ncbi:hypothetical protein TSAR_010746 [Trichomalopsis sarcophagae]|uniref:Uncharacterized protein n=1 Tax=Trichomalopsis sarcophagae TaxID=543379 RepID=A0A232EZZ4_9HYME|nr:hypothetical protein TSAR_010746 [Trichomalopsis sarcophagae]